MLRQTATTIQTVTTIMTQAGIWLYSVLNSKAGLSGSPLSPSKVGDLDRNTALGNRELGKRSVHTHNDGVIDVNRRLRSILDGLDEELQLAQVSAAMTTESGLPGPGVSIFLMIRRKRFPLVIFWALALNVNSVSLFVVEAASALNKPAIIVWPG